MFALFKLTMVIETISQSAPVLVKPMTVGHHLQAHHSNSPLNCQQQVLLDMTSFNRYVLFN